MSTLAFMTAPTIAETELAEVLGALEGVSHAHESPRDSVLRLVEERSQAVSLAHSAQEAARVWQRRAETAEAVLVRTAAGL